MSAQQLTQKDMALMESLDKFPAANELDEALYQELKAGATAPRSDFVNFDVELIIQHAKDRRAAR